MVSHRRAVVALALAFAAACCAPVAMAQSSGKVTRIFVGFAAGGSVDILGRVLAEKIRSSYAPTVIVENRPGAGGRLAAEALKSSSGDGNAILLTPPGVIAINPHIYKELAYDALRDFTPVTTIAVYPFVIGIGPRVPAKVSTLANFLQWCKQNPKEAAYGSPGPGTPPHFTGVMLSKVSGVPLTHVPYKGMAPLMQDLIGGQISSGVLAIGDAVPHVNDGKLRFLAQTGPTRSHFLPDIPTVRELGLKELEYQEWFGIFVPSSTPAEVVAKLATSVRGALDAADVRARMTQLGLEALAMPTAEFQRAVRADYERWGAIVKASGFSLEQ